MKVSQTTTGRGPGHYAYDRFRNMILQSPVAMCILKGPALIVEVANSRMFELWGRGAREMINQPVFQALPEAREQGLEQLIRSVYVTGKAVTAHERPVSLPRQEGTETLYINFVYDAFRDEDGNIIGVIAVASDVTEQVSARRKMEESEAELQKRVKERTSDLEQQKALIHSILSNSPAGITVYKVIRDSTGQPCDFQCILANDASAEFTGIPVKERYSKTIMETVPGLEGTALFKMAVAAVEKGESFSSEYYYEPAKKWLELAVVKIYEGHLINVFRDITEIKEAHLQLEAQIEKLEGMNVKLAHFTYAASHDMKEPLRKVLIFSDRLKESLAAQLSPEQQHYLERIESATKRMNLLIDELLTYHEVSDKAPSMTHVDLNELIREVLDDLELEITEKQAHITTDKLFTIHGSRRQLQQVFQNLIGNALKYSKPDTVPQIRITCRKVSGKETDLRLSSSASRETYFMVSISDNGIGFDPEDAKRIFNVFERLHQSKTYGGTGLGLAIVRNAVENHHGFITAEGALGVGATFNAFFPAYAVREDSDNQTFNRQQ